MNEAELRKIIEYIEMKLAHEKAIGLIVTPLQATAPLVTRLVAEYGEQAARIAELDERCVIAEAHLSACRELRQQMQARIAELDAEVKRLRSALEQAEDIRDTLVSNAEDIGELVFRHKTVDEVSGLERYACAHDCDDLTPVLLLKYGDAKRVANLINECLDADWIDTTGERQ